MLNVRTPFIAMSESSHSLNEGLFSADYDIEHIMHTCNNKMQHKSLFFRRTCLPSATLKL